MNCDFARTEIGGGQCRYVCRRPGCERHKTGVEMRCARRVIYECTAKEAKPRESSGPGTELKALLSKLGFTSTDSCPCNKRARLMDERGSDWCAENLEEIVDFLEEEAKKRGIKTFSRKAARVIVKLAIWKARRKAKKDERRR